MPSLAQPPPGIVAVNIATRVKGPAAGIHRGAQVQVKPRDDMPPDADIYLPAVVAEEPKPDAKEVKVTFMTGGHGVHHKQQEVGQLMCDAVTAQVMRQQEGGAKYRDVAMFIVCPRINSLCAQTVDRMTKFASWGRSVASEEGLGTEFMPSLGPDLEHVEDHVIKLQNNDGSADKARFRG